MTKENKIEVCRSFSRKLNLGNYETLDMFASAKSEVDEKDKEKISEELFEFVKSEVMKSVSKYKMENTPQPKKVTREDFIKSIKEAPERQAQQEKADELSQERAHEKEIEKFKGRLNN